MHNLLQNNDQHCEKIYGGENTTETLKISIELEVSA